MRRSHARAGHAAAGRAGSVATGCSSCSRSCTRPRPATRSSASSFEYSQMVRARRADRLAPRGFAELVADALAPRDVLLELAAALAAGEVVAAPQPRAQRLPRIAAPQLGEPRVGERAHSDLGVAAVQHVERRGDARVDEALEAADVGDRYRRVVVLF